MDETENIIDLMDDDSLGNVATDKGDSLSENSLPDSSVAEKDKNTNSNQKKDLKELSAELAMNTYAFASVVKKNGHATVADMLFKEAMNVQMASNLASEAIGREKFIGFLELGYYASGKVMEYLKFLAFTNISNGNHGKLFDDALTVHKIFAASIKTVTNKKQAAGVGL